MFRIHLLLIVFIHILPFYFLACCSSPFRMSPPKRVIYNGRLKYSSTSLGGISASREIYFTVESRFECKSCWLSYEIPIQKQVLFITLQGIVFGRSLTLPGLIAVCYTSPLDEGLTCSASSTCTASLDDFHAWYLSKNKSQGIVESSVRVLLRPSRELTHTVAWYR